jgi:ribonuclease HII
MNRPVIRPKLGIERSLWKRGFKFLIGIDEVGRGALAGPVVVGGVVLTKESNLIDGVTDSKLIPEKRRKQLAGLIQKSGVQISFGEASNREIDEIGIVAAIELAISRMLLKVGQVDAIILDGHFSETFKDALQLPTYCFVKGDLKSYAIGAASLVAKVYRDDYMMEKDVEYPEYLWKQNKGYGTAQHRKAIESFGLSPLHRTTFIK